MWQKAIFILLCLLVCACSQKTVKSRSESISTGDYGNGKLIHSWKLPRKAPGIIYFSRFSYYVLGNAYVNSRVYRTITAAGRELKVSHPERKFVIMECSNKHGGKMLLHRTHQNGLNVDFMSPMIKQGERPKYFRLLGIFRYLLNSDGTGKINRGRNVSIDFNAMADHLIAIHKHALKNGLKIRRVILKTELHNELMSSNRGKLLAAKGITFAQNLSPMLNKAHDDHYHVNFEIVP